MVDTNLISLGNFAWEDKNGNGLQDEGEKGLAGVTIKLWSLNKETQVWSVVDSLVTESDGFYEFSDMAPGTYKVQFISPTAYTYTQKEAGSNKELDSNADSQGFSKVMEVKVGDVIQDIDAGFVRRPLPSSLGDHVWEDVNGNGVQDANEPGIKGVVVKAIDSKGDVVATTTTDSSGYYNFNELTAGTYKVKFTSPQGYVFTVANADGVADDVDSDANQEGLTGNYVLEGGAGNKTADAGLYKPASVGDKVWLDSNGDGKQDAGEAGIAGVTVNLLDKTGNLLKTTVTDSNGEYHFTNLKPGDYKVKFVAPNGKEFTTQDATVEDQDSDANSSGLTGVFNVKSGENITNVDAGLVNIKTAQIGDRVWEDSNANGVQDTGEKGVANAKVELVRDLNSDGDFNDAGEVLATTNTNADGLYSFTGLLPGSGYQVRFTAPTNLDQTSPRHVGDKNSDSDGLLSDAITLAPDEKNQSVDAGFYAKASVGDYVWHDQNQNGKQDSTEAGLANITVKLFNQNKSLVAETKTDAQGKYLFKDLTPGEYQMQFVAPNGYIFAKQDAQIGKDIDSNADKDGWSEKFTLKSGEQNLSIDAGLHQPKGTAKLGDFVWLDTDANGKQDLGEAGVANVTVKLLDANGQLHATTKTDASGRYEFTELVAGRYKVQFEAPNNFVFTVPNAPVGDTRDSDADSTGLTGWYQLANGQINHTVDAGLRAADPKTAKIGDYVWHDENENGKQDANETGIAGVLVKLLKASDGSVVATTLTDKNGKYLFTELLGGEYKVQFAAPQGFHFTQQDATVESLDSDAGTGGLTGVINLAPAQVNLDVDAGLHYDDPKNAAIGDHVWHDSNENGKQDAGEAGIAGVTVHLLKATDGTVLATTTTDATGQYLFKNLAEGQYKVQFVSPTGYVLSTQNAQGVADDVDSDAGQQGITGVYTLARSEVNKTVDAGMYKPDPKTAALGDYVWHDKNENGKQDAGEQGLAGVTVKLLNAADGSLITTTVTDAAGKYKFEGLAAGSYKVQFVSPTGYVLSTQNAPGVSDDLDSDAGQSGITGTYVLARGQVNKTVDAGMHQPDPKTAALGDYVWNDANKNGKQDTGEAGIAGVTVKLLKASDGSTVATTQTDQSGHYIFTELLAGQYKVQFVTPTGYVISTQDAPGVTDDLDSDAAQSGLTGVYTLARAEVNKTVDAGMYVKDTTLGSIGDRVWIDKDVNGLQDNGEISLAGVNVRLHMVDPVTKQWKYNIASTSTDSQGNYLFEDLKAGQYAIAFDAPTGYKFTKANQGTDEERDSDPRVFNDDKTIGTAYYTLKAGEHTRSVDAGVYDTRTAKLGDRVWEDSNFNGKQDDGEASLAGVAVHLLDKHNKVIGNATTDVNGNYLFDKLVPGQYKVKFDAPNGYVATFANMKGVPDSLDSDAGANGLSGAYTLKDGESNMTVDAGYVQASKLASIGNFVWNDANKNGIQDAGEKGMKGVTVNLYGPNGMTDKTTTDANGHYKFDKLIPGTYQVEFKEPTDYVFTKRYAGGNINSDHDSNANPAKNGDNGTTDKIVLQAGENNMTIDAGLYYVPPAPTKFAIGDRVWNDRNKNGLQDSNEEGVGGITLKLYNSNSQHIASATTDGAGYYSFSNLDAGNYRLKVDVEWKNKPGRGWDYWLWNWQHITTQNAGNDTADSDFNKSTGWSDWITLNASSDNFNRHAWDLGITPIVLDLNGDGIHTLSRTSSEATFDLLGNGSPIKSGWISGNDGFLAIDSNHDGRINNINELFGGMQKGDGFAKLASFDSNHDGVVDLHDVNFDQLQIWRDVNGNHQTDDGELMSLADVGIASLNVGYDVIPELDAQGNVHLERSVANRSDGSTVKMEDVYFSVDAADAARASVDLPSVSELLSSDSNLDSLMAALVGPKTAEVATNGQAFGASELDSLKHLVNAYDQAATLVA